MRRKFSKIVALVVSLVLLAMPIVLAGDYLTCEEFEENDFNVWYKDEIVYNEKTIDDYCMDNVLYELTCLDSGFVNYRLWACPRGCSKGRCIYSGTFLVHQYSKNEITSTNFFAAVNAWIAA